VASAGAESARTTVRAFRYMLAHAGWAAPAVIALDGAAGAFPLASLWIVKRVVDILTESPGVDRDEDELILVAAAFFAIAILTQLAVTALVFLRDTTKQRLEGASRASLLEKVNTFHGLHYFEIPQFHDHLRNANEGAGVRLLNVLDVSSEFTRFALVLGAALALLGSLHPLLGLILVVGLLPHAIVAFRITRHSVAVFRAQAEDVRIQRYYEGVLTDPTTAKEVRAFGLGGFFLGKYRDAFGRVFERRHAFRVRSAKVYAASGAFSGTVSAAAFAWVVAKAYAGELSVGDAVLYIGVLPQVSSALRALMSSVHRAHENSLYLRFLLDLLDMRPVLRNGTLVPGEHVAAQADTRRDGGATMRSARTAPPAYEFRDVTFRYPGSDEPALRGVSFAMDRGQKLALVGRNGAGKTTLVKLLLRFYDPDEGEILLDGVGLQRYDVEQLRRRTSVVFQDYAKYYLTVRESIALGDPSRQPDDEWVHEAARKAGAHEFVERLPGGYDTLLGKHFEGGTDISGGQWQRLALARAFAHDADTVVLDEPSAALDPMAEYDLYRKFHDLIEHRSVLFVTHRLGSVRMVDRVIVLRDGQLVESGAHDDLMEADGEYATLFRMQAANYV